MAIKSHQRCKQTYAHVNDYAYIHHSVRQFKMDDGEKSLRSTLVGNVRNIQRQHGYPDLGRAFQHWLAVNILGLESANVSDFLADAMGRDGGVDYLNKNVATETIEIVQAKFSEELNAKIGRDVIGALYDVPVRLGNSTSNNSLRFQQYQKIYKAACAEGYATNLIFVVAGNLSEDTKEYIRLKNQDLPKNTTFEYFEIKDLLGVVGNPITPTWTLQLFENEYFISKSKDGRIKKMVATITASELKHMYESIGAPTLFSLNPRSYLGYKDISQKIATTICDEPDKLWHYNNGISAVCKHFERDENTGTVKIKNLKIVNGCQTITTIGRESVLSPNASVVFRLSEADDSKFKENISKYTNSQNRILFPDLASDHPYLLELEQRFTKYKPFFWERKKGTRAYIDKDHKKRIAGKPDLYIMKNVDVARLKLAYHGRPDLSIRLSQQDLFDDAPNRVDTYFIDLYKDADPRDFLVPHILHYWLNIIKKRLGKDERVSDTVKDKNMRFLLKYSIGKYYVVGLIGKILNSIKDHNTKNQLIDKIIATCSNYNEDNADKLIAEIEKLVGWTSYAVPKILRKHNDSDGNEEIKTRQLHNHVMYELRDGLSRVNKLNSLYEEREGLWYESGHESFETELKTIFNL